MSCATETVLRDGNLPMYWTEPNNAASQELCKGLGYRQYAQQINYIWRRAESP